MNFSIFYHDIAINLNVFHLVFNLIDKQKIMPNFEVGGDIYMALKIISTLLRAYTVPVAHGTPVSQRHIHCMLSVCLSASTALVPLFSPILLKQTATIRLLN